MSDELELVRGSDNPFEDVGLPEADTKRIKADLAAEIVGIVRERHVTGAAAAQLVGIQTADISRIRNADVSRFTIDRLVHILNRLNRHVEMRVTVRTVPGEHAAPLWT